MPDPIHMLLKIPPKISVGLNTKVVEGYIRNQEKEDMVQDNLSTKEHVDPFKG